MRISDWSSDVCSSDLKAALAARQQAAALACDAIEATPVAAEKPVRADRLQGPEQFCVRRRGPAHLQILFDRAAEQDRILADEPQLRPQMDRRILPTIQSIAVEASARRRQKTPQQ